jgi:ABC-type branched-subunit amino acid transport system ATPase component/branched-subunit amino acid ABC-type transport system permease component
VVVGLPSLRLRGVYLAVSTLALHFVVIYLGSEYQARRQASTGVVVPVPTIGPLALSDPGAWFFVLVGGLVLAILVSRNLLRTQTGRAWMALRDRELAASSVGVNLTTYKLAAFVISSAMTSLAGALGAYYHHFVAIEGYTFFLTTQYIAMVLIGGVTSVAGAVAGAAFVVLLPQVVNVAVGMLPVPPQFKLYVSALQYVLFGLLMAGFILFEPGGLVRIWDRARRWRQSLHRSAGSRDPACTVAGPTQAAEGSTCRGIVQPAPAFSSRRLGCPRLRLLDGATATSPNGTLGGPTAPANRPALLEVCDLSVNYGGLATAVDGVSLRVPEGSIVALLGANGAGKTTTLRAISGLLATESARITHGDVRLAGRSVAGWPTDRIARAGIVLVPERDKIFGTLTVEQNLAVTAGQRRAGFDEARMRAAIDRYFPVLGRRRRQLAGYLSGGERQMLALACALLCAPRMLLVDELSLGLAPGPIRQLMQVLDDFRREMDLTILLVEQNAAAALAVADHAYVLSTGRLVKQGSPAALRADPEVRSLYLGVGERRHSYREPDAVVSGGTR